MACRSSGRGSNERAFVSSRSIELAVAMAAAAAAAAAVVAFLLAAVFVLAAADGSPSFAAFDRLVAAAAGAAGTAGGIAAVEVDAPLPSAGAQTTTAGTLGGFLARIRKLGSASKCSPVL